jgi:hypothetical protein
MTEQERQSQADSFSDRYGMDPEVVENLVSSQRRWEAKGVQMDLVEVFALEYGRHPSEPFPGETLA